MLLIYSAFQVVPSSELQSLLAKRVQWHNANISNFIETWKEYVDPIQGGGPAAAAGGATQSSMLDTSLPE